MSANDLLIEGGTIVTLDPRWRVFEGDLLVREGRIAELGSSGSLRVRPGTRTLSARGGYVLPGFVQPHVHLCQALFRGFAEDVPLLPWLSRFIWPMEAAHTPTSLRVSAELGIAELLLGGTTTALDMGTVHYTDAIFEVALESGIRLVSGKAMMDAGTSCPPGLREERAWSLAESRRLAERWHGADGGRLHYAFAPRFILSCTPELLRDTAELARAMGCRLHTHASENPDEVDAVRALTGMENVAALHQLGISGPDVVLAHCVWLSAPEQDLLRRTGTRVSHCPSANLKLGSGVASVPELLRAGVSVGLAADGAPCNNRLSAFTEMRLAALLQKPRAGTDALAAREVLRMATLGGAEVLGLEAQIGSLEVGKRADLIVVEGRRPHLRPRSDPYHVLVYAAEAADVKHVFVEGRALVRDHRLVAMNVGDMLERAEVEIAGVLSRSGVGCTTTSAAHLPSDSAREKA